jgi:multiple antibiotic resistance protein
MLDAAKTLFLVLSGLFPIVDPLGGSPFFLALTKEYTPEARKILSWRIAMYSFFLLVGSYFVGTYILAFFGMIAPQRKCSCARHCTHGFELTTFGL